MNRTLSLLLIGFAALAMEKRSHAADPEAGKPLGQTFSLSGNVIDSSGMPVAAATVEIRSTWVGDHRADDESKRDDLLTSAKTNASGQFTFPDVPIPRHRSLRGNQFAAYVLARAPGHGFAWAHFRGAKSEPLTLTLARPAAIRGQVVDSAGKPVAGARVKLLNLLTLAKAPDWLNLERCPTGTSAVTDVGGMFSLTDLPQETRSKLRVTHDDFLAETVLFATALKPQPKEFTDHDYVLGDLVSKKPLYTSDFKLVLRPGCRVKGQCVFADTGAGIAGVRLTFRSGDSFSEVNTDKEGRFNAGHLLPGKCRYLATPAAFFQGEESEYLMTEGELALPADERDAAPTIKLLRGTLVTGQVIDEDTGKGVAGIKVFFQPEELADLKFYHFKRSITKSDGTFRLAVGPGQGNLFVGGSELGYFTPDEPINWPAPIRPERSSYMARTVGIRSGEPLKDIVIKIGRGLVVNGRVLDPRGKPLPSVAIYRLTQAGFSFEAPDQVTSPDGTFALSALDPTQTNSLIFLYEERQLGAYLELSSEKGATIIEGREVKLEPLVTLTGRALSEEKKPLPLATVNRLACITVTRHGRSSTHRYFHYGRRLAPKTDKEGRFTVAGLIPGMPHFAHVSAPGHATTEIRFTAAASKPHDLGDVVLPRADQAVAGVMVDLSGKPVEGASVDADLRGRSLSGHFHATTDSEGRFRIDQLPRGDVQLFVNARPRGSHQIYANITAEAGKTDLRIVLSLSGDSIKASLGKPAVEFGVTKWINAGKKAGRRFALADYQGQVLLLALLDDSKPSQRLLPQLAALQEKFAAKKLAILRVYEADSTDERSVESITKSSSLPTVLTARGAIPGGFGEAFTKYGVRATPALFLIDRAGVLREADIEPADLQEKIEKLLAR